MFRSEDLRVVRKTVGWTLMLGSIAVAGWLIFTLADYGTCSTGGPYVVERECAPGTGLKMVGIFAAVFLALVGMGLAASFRAAAAAWGLTFTGGAAMFFSFGFTDGLLAWTFIPLGVVFSLMGLPGIWVWLKPPSAADRRKTKLVGPNGIELSVDAPEDGGPAPIVMAKLPGMPRG